MINRKTRYARLEGAFWSNEKVCSVSLAAVGLHAKAIAYCADKMTDGRVPKWMVPALAVGVDIAELVTELLRVTTCNTSKKLRPMWIDKGDYYQLHDYEKSNITSAEWEIEKERARKGMAKKRNENKEISGDIPEDESVNVTRNNPVTLQPCYGAKTQDSGHMTQEGDPERAREDTPASGPGAAPGFYPPAQAAGPTPRRDCIPPAADPANRQAILDTSTLADLVGEIRKARGLLPYRSKMSDYQQRQDGVDEILAIAAERKRPPADVARIAYRNFLDSADPWLIEHAYPIGAFCSNVGQYYEPPPKADRGDGRTAADQQAERNRKAERKQMAEYEAKMKKARADGVPMPPELRAVVGLK